MNIFDKIYTKNKENAIKDILSVYFTKGYCVVHFLYFATLIAGKVFEDKSQSNVYLKSMLDADFILPDGIALQLLGRRHYGINYDNLNGTDFMPFFLDNIKGKYEKINIALYGAFPQDIGPAKEEFERISGLKVFYHQQGYGKFNNGKGFDYSVFDGVEGFNILLVGRGSPRQEEEVFLDMEEIKNQNLLVFTVGGWFDFLAGIQTRAPKIFIILKLEWLWRLITDPKRNYKKVLNSLLLLKFLLKKNI